MNLADFCNKIKWEGGIIPALEYGLSADDLEEGNEQVQEIWNELDSIYADLEFTILRLKKIIGDDIE